MKIDDPEIPAVAHLVGAGAHEPLAAAVAHAGGHLHDAHVTQVQYRPGADAVIRYRCDITWPSGRRRRDVLFAAADRDGTRAGAIPVQATTPDGSLDVSVWRWPFDPALPGLASAVTPSQASEVLSDLGIEIGGSPQLEVVAHRATERAVIRVGPPGAAHFVKVVPPATARALARRHDALGHAGVPVPPVLGVDDERGLLVLGELRGQTLRDRVKQGHGRWPDPVEVRTILDRIATAACDDLPCAADRLEHAPSHAALLRTVAPDYATRLDAVLDALGPAGKTTDAQSTVIHGDLHEAQLIVDDDGRISGVLDIDDVGWGHPASDPATLIAHLRFRGLTTPAGAPSARVLAHADRLREAYLPTAGRSLDRRIAAVLVGLATGPFRIQRDGWREDIGRVVDEAHRFATPA